MNAPRAAPGRVRIIAGTLRGSRLQVPDSPGLRPTPDRLRETLFNWLAPCIAGARVLDAYAGSGALGIEAASRGAAQLRLIERDAALAAALRANLARLPVNHAEVQAGDALTLLAAAPDTRYDVVFLDPPFAADLWSASATALLPWLAPQARVYVERPLAQVEPVLPAHWRLLRQTRVGAVLGALYDAGGAAAR